RRTWSKHARLILRQLTKIRVANCTTPTDTRSQCTNIRALRRRLRLTQAAFAARYYHLSRRVVANWECGRDTLRGLDDAINVDRARARRHCPHPGVAAVKFVAHKEKIRAARSASLTSAADRAAMAPGEFNASKLGDPRDDGHFAAAAVTAGRGA